MTTLTPAELRVLVLTANGLTRGQTAARLGLSLQTVKNHHHTAYRRLGVHSLAGALAAMGWLRPPETP